MKLLKQKTEIKNSILVFGGIIISILLLAWLWPDFATDTKWGPIVSGILTGLIVALVQLLLSWREMELLDHYGKMKISEILLRRNNKTYYKTLLSSAQERIMVQGVTAQRLLHDFANNENTENGAKVLLEALARGVNVRILVSSYQHLEKEEDKSKAIRAQEKLGDILRQYPNKFNFAYFDHLPAHSIFVVDNESIVGPVFPGVSSEFTPAIHFNGDSEFARKYIDYFDREWDRWKHNQQLRQS